jgi:hypothetical protein
MIRTLMKVIREVITWGVTVFSLKGNLVLRFTKGGGAQVNDEECLDVTKEKVISSQLKRGKFFMVSHATSLFNDMSISP